MSKRYDDELLRLQEELMAAEEEDCEEYEDYEEDLDLSEFLEEEDPDEYDADEDDGIDDAVNIVARRYGRGSPKKFEDREFFDTDVDDGEVLYKKDYKKAKRKKARSNIGLVILAVLELLGIVLVLLWWSSWAM